VVADSNSSGPPGFPAQKQNLKTCNDRISLGDGLFQKEGSDCNNRATVRAVECLYGESSSLDVLKVSSERLIVDSKNQGLGFPLLGLHNGSTGWGFQSPREGRRDRVGGGLRGAGPVSNVTPLWAPKWQRFANTVAQQTRKARSRSRSKPRTISSGHLVHALPSKGKESLDVGDSRAESVCSQTSVEEEGVESTQEVDNVPETQAHNERDERLQVVQNLKESLLRCKSEEEIEIWLKWLVSPLSGALGVTDERGSEEVEKLYRQLCKQKGGEDEATDASMNAPSEMLDR
ncbi:hypothetical protein FRX31_025939, partial [Thalictrum thalictroides]